MALAQETAPVSLAEHEDAMSSIPDPLAGIVETIRETRDVPDELERLLHRSVFPMITVDGERRFIDANGPARLVFRHTLDELRKLHIEDLTPPERMGDLESAWDQLVTAGKVSGSYEVGFPDGSRLDVVYWAIADALRACHLVVFAPANWPEDELSSTDVAGGHREVRLTPRELEVLRLSAMGNSAGAMAAQLVIGESTVKTHLANLYAKLGVSDRAAAVAIAFRMGLID
jgi:DNA-binding CsgD family transcriptional regulator